MARIVRLTGVYAADGGIRGELAYLIGKAQGRHCSLCDITHSPVRRRREWDAFVAGLSVPFTVVHRNERSPAMAAVSAGREPCVLAETDDGSLVVVMDDSDLRSSADVEGFARALDGALRAANLDGARG